MARRPGQKIALTSIDELLCVPETEGTIDIEVDAIYPFENHPFKVLYDDKMEELVESIKVNGVLTPVLLRPDYEGNYEMISGHRRLKAAKIAGLRKIPAIIKEMTNDEATIAMVDANLQREKILPSEKAFSYKMKLDAMKRQGKRNDLTSSQKGTRSRADEELAEQTGSSRMQIHRFIRLTELIPSLLNMVDNNRLALTMATEFSYFNENVQQWLYEYIKKNGMIKQEQIMELRQYREDKSMTQEQLINLLIKTKSTHTKRKKIIITEGKLSKYFPAYYSLTEIEKVIVELLEQWKDVQEGEANE